MVNQAPPSSMPGEPFQELSTHSSRLPTMSCTPSGVRHPFSRPLGATAPSSMVMPECPDSSLLPL